MASVLDNPYYPFVVDGTATAQNQEPCNPVAPITIDSSTPAYITPAPRIPCTRQSHPGYNRVLTTNAILAYLLSFAAQAAAYTYAIYLVHPLSTSRSSAVLHNAWQWLPLGALFLVNVLSGTDHVIRNTRCLARSEDVDPCLYPAPPVTHKARPSPGAPGQAAANSAESAIARHSGAKSIWGAAVYLAVMVVVSIAIVLALFAGNRTTYHFLFNDDSNDETAPPAPAELRSSVLGVLWVLAQHGATFAVLGALFAGAAADVSQDCKDISQDCKDNTNSEARAKHEKCCEKCRERFEPEQRARHRKGPVWILFMLVAVVSYVVALLVYGFREEGLLFCAGAWKALKIVYAVMVGFACVWLLGSVGGSVRAGLRREGKEGSAGVEVRGPKARKVQMIA